MPGMDLGGAGNLFGGVANAITGMSGVLNNDNYFNLDPRFQQVFRDRANAAPSASPYNAQTGAQTQAAQSALLAQMQATGQGPGVAGMQARQAQGDMLRQALAASPGAGSAVAAQAALAQQQLNNQAGLARLQEQMASQQNQGALSGQMRQGAQQNAAQQVEAALQQRQLDDAATRFYASQGANYALAQQMQAAKNLALRQAYMNQAVQGGFQALGGGLSMAGSAAGTMMGGKR